MKPTIRVTAPRRLFEDHESSVLVVAVFPDGRRMVTGSMDRTLRLWDLKEGIVLKKMEGHQDIVRSVTVSRDGQLIASGDQNGELIAWNGDTGESLIQAVKVHSTVIRSLDFSLDGTVLASGSADKTTELWCTKTWQVQRDPINCGGNSNGIIHCVRFSPSGEFLAISTDGDIQVWNPWTMECIAKFKAAINDAHNYSLAWMPDGTRLFSSGSGSDPTIREWDTSTWRQVGNPWTGHANDISTIAINSNGALIASASDDHQVRLWRLSDRRTIAIFKDVNEVYCAAFSTDSKKIFSGSRNTITNLKEWAVPDVALIEDTPKEQASY